MSDDAPARRPRLGSGIVRKLVTLVVIVFAGLVLTVWMRGLWTLLEARTGLESIGHNGPALWCYFVVWGVLALLLWPRRR